MGASLNDSLWNLVGATIATESRALQPAGGARWTPDINLFRDPRW
jgi:beta-glucosidase-like glycosyl hydrolase